MFSSDLHWQCLEARRHLSATLDGGGRRHVFATLDDAGTLFVGGTWRDDVIRVALDDLSTRPGFAKRPVYAVRVNGKTTVIDAEVVERIEVDARGGDDDVRVAHSTHGLDLVWGDGAEPVDVRVTLRGG